MSKKQKKVRYYTDPLNDDFAVSNGKIKPRCVNSSFKYIHHNPFWVFMALIVRHVIAPPVAWFICRIMLGVRIINKKNLKKIKTGCFMYANHTSTLGDSFIPCLLTIYRKGGFRIITGDDAFNLPYMKNFVSMIGAIPLPHTLGATKNYLKALQHYVKLGAAITIYPEAHLWPYYNGIREYKDGSFSYPYKYKVPAIGITIVYKQRKVFKSWPPTIKVVVGEAEYPNLDLPEKEARLDLRNRIYKFHTDTVQKYESYAHIEYIQKDKEDEQES